MQITSRGYRPFASFRSTILARGGSFIAWQGVTGRYGILWCGSWSLPTNPGVKTERKAVLNFVLAFTSVFHPGTRLYSRLGGGGASNIFGGHRPRNALQWHRPCNFLLEHNPHLGGTSSDLGGTICDLGVTAPKCPFLASGQRPSLVTQQPVCSFSSQTLSQCYWFFFFLLKPL